MLTIDTEISDADLREAIELKMSGCYTALEIANRFGGSQSDAWDVARSRRLADLVSDAIDRDLPVSQFRAAVSGESFTEFCGYMRLRDEIGGKAGFPI